jgi:hypothetical protein
MKSFMDSISFTNMIVATDCGLTDDNVVAMLDSLLRMHDLNAIFLANDQWALPKLLLKTSSFDDR